MLHPGSAKTGEVGPAIARAGEVIREALAESERCPLHLENTAGAGGTLGRSSAELHQIIDAAGGDERLGLCLDSCHLLASGYEIRTREGLDATLDECDREVGLGRLRALHFNDSQMPLGSNRDRHANAGEGELGADGCAVFLSDPRFEDLPCVLETPGPNKEGPTVEEISLVRSLRERGLSERSRLGRLARDDDGYSKSSRAGPWPGARRSTRRRARPRARRCARGRPRCWRRRRSSARSAERK